jgi:hypothetical protein
LEKGWRAPENGARQLDDLSAGLDVDEQNGDCDERNNHHIIRNAFGGGLGDFDSHVAGPPRQHAKNRHKILLSGCVQDALLVIFSTY